MKTNPHDVRSTDMAQVLADARGLQAAHGAKLFALALSRLRNGVSRALSAEAPGSAARLRLH